MKKILIATALLAGFTFAATPVDTAKFTHKVDTGKFVRPAFDTAKVDSILKAHKAKVDSSFAEFKKHVPDSLKRRVDTAEKAWKLADTSKGPGKIDSLKKFNHEKRDTAIAKIKDTATAAKVKARIAALEGKKAELKAKLDARKAAIDAKIEAIKKAKK
jgi:hypothetical protein